MVAVVFLGHQRLIVMIRWVKASDISTLVRTHTYFWREERERRMLYKIVALHLGRFRWYMAPKKQSHVEILIQSPH